MVDFDQVVEGNIIKIYNLYFKILKNSNKQSKRHN